MRFLLVAAFTLSLLEVQARRTVKKYNTGATRSNVPGVLNVHIIAHTQ